MAMPRLPEESGCSARTVWTGVRRRARAGVNRRPVSFHQESAIGLLSVAHLHHVDSALEVEQPTRHRQGAAPLPTSFRRQTPNTGFLVVVRLGKCRIWLVAANRAGALIFIVDVRRSLEKLLQPMRAMERARPPEFIGIAYFVRNVDPALGADFLGDDIHREDRGKISGTDRLHRSRMERRVERAWQIGGNVIPLSR